MLPTVGSKSLGEEAGVDNGAVRGSEASKGPEDRPYQECTRGGRGRCRATSGRGAGDEVVAAAHGAGAGRRRGAEDDEVGARTSRMRLGRRRQGRRRRGGRATRRAARPARRAGPRRSMATRSGARGRGPAGDPRAAGSWGGGARARASEQDARPGRRCRSENCDLWERREGDLLGSACLAPAGIISRH